MHCFEDLLFKFEICREIKKDENTWNIEKIYENTKNGNQTLTNVPLAMKKSQPKNQKNYFFAESLVGPSAKAPVSMVGRQHRRVLCRRPQLALGKGQSTGVNPGQCLCREPWRGRSAQVASVPTASRRSRRHSGRQPKCDGARSFSDGAIRAEGWLSAKSWLCHAVAELADFDT
jgi:hypothetical protein